MRKSILHKSLDFEFHEIPHTIGFYFPGKDVSIHSMIRLEITETEMNVFSVAYIAQSKTDQEFWCDLNQIDLFLRKAMISKVNSKNAKNFFFNPFSCKISFRNGPKKFVQLTPCYHPQFAHADTKLPQEIN